MPKIGDIVRYLNDVGGGRVIRIDGNVAWVDDEGFETPVLLRECVVVRTAEEVEAENNAVKRADPRITTVAPKTPAASGTTYVDDDEPNDDETEEIPGGDKLNIVVGFEPTERTRLSQTDFDASLINDSNYYLYFSLNSRDDDSEDWTCRYAGMVEPNTELWLGTYSRTDIATFDHLCLQYVAFKRGKGFEMKPVGSVSIKVDTAKFFKLHCFRENKYFENPVLAFSFVENDVAAGSKAVNIEQLRHADFAAQPKRPERRAVSKREHPRRSESVDKSQPLVVDLHIDELVDTRAGMSSSDMLNLQVDTFRSVMDKNLRNYGRKIIFIHGKGEGVLRQALTKELNHRYAGHEVCDASFQEYGYGATQVTIRQHPDTFKHRRKPTKG